MSNVIGSTKGTPYFQVPDSFVRTGDLRDLSGSAVKYYVFLCREINRTGQVELEFTNEEICTFTGISDHSTARKAREELQERGRIKLRRGPSGGFIHALLGDDGIVFSPAKGRRAVRLHMRTERPGGRSDRIKEATASTEFTRRFCYAHNAETEHWQQGGTFVCNECHPPLHTYGSRTPASSRKPGSSSAEVLPAWRPPSARDIGF